MSELPPKDDLVQVSERVFQAILGTELGDNDVNDNNDGRHHKEERILLSE